MKSTGVKLLAHIFSLTNLLNKIITKSNAMKQNFSAKIKQ